MIDDCAIKDCNDCNHPALHNMTTFRTQLPDSQHLSCHACTVPSRHLALPWVQTQTPLNPLCAFACCRSEHGSASGASDKQLNAAKLQLKGVTWSAFSKGNTWHGFLPTGVAGFHYQQEGNKCVTMASFAELLQATWQF